MMSHLEPDNLSDLDGYVLKTLHERTHLRKEWTRAARFVLAPSWQATKIRHYKDWPVSKIVEALYNRNIPAPSGASHKELFKFAMRHLDIPDVATGSPVTPSSPSKKCAAKKNCSCSSANSNFK